MYNIYEVTGSNTLICLLGKKWNLIRVSCRKTSVLVLCGNIKFERDSVSLGCHFLQCPKWIGCFWLSDSTAWPFLVKWSTPVCSWLLLWLCLVIQGYYNDGFQLLVLSLDIVKTTCTHHPHNGKFCSVLWWSRGFLLLILSSFFST